MTEKIVALGARVVVRPDKEEEATPAGILLPFDRNEDVPRRGVIVHVGRGKYEGGKLCPVRLTKGSTVLFSHYAGVKVEENGEELLVLMEEDVMAEVMNSES